MSCPKRRDFPRCWNSAAAKAIISGIFFSAPVKPDKIRGILENIRRSVSGDISAFNMEVFPKQDYLKGKGLGNLVKLPLGVHRLTGKRSYFTKCRFRTLEAQLDFLSGVKMTSPEDLEKVDNETAPGTLFLHPRWEAYARSFPELISLETKCPPLAQIISACRNGKSLTLREEKIILQTIGFLPRSKTLMHHLFSSVPEYNPHLVGLQTEPGERNPPGLPQDSQPAGLPGGSLPHGNECGLSAPPSPHRRDGDGRF